MKHNRKIIYIAGFLLSIPIALTSYVNSSNLETYTGKYNLGIIYAIASLLTILGMLEMPRILTRLGNRFTTLLFSILFLFSLILLAIGGKGFIVIPAFILYFISTNFIFASLDIFIEDFSKNSPVGGIRGIYLTIINSAWIIAQIISGSIIAKSSFEGIYLFSALFMALICIIFTLFLHDFKDPKYKKVPMLKTISFFIQRKNILKIYFLNLILRFFYVWMVIYTPIYLHEYIGFDWGEIGIIFSIMLLPFIILEFPLGELSDKIGEKKMLTIGFLIISISTLAIPFFTTKTLLLWAFILFMTRVGAAIIEVMSENYFFKSIKEENADEISFFRNTNPVSFILAPLLAILVFLVVPSFQFLFYILGVVMLCGFLISLRLRDVK
ncbi:MAG: MFS transporter [bacterium]